MSKKKTTIDPIAWMATNFQHTPPSALAAFNGANKKRGTKAVWSLTVTPTATAPRPRTTPQTPSEYKAPVLGRHIVATLRALPGDMATDALMSMRAGLSRLRGYKDSDAEEHLRSRGLKPFAIATTVNPAGGGYLTPDPVAEAIYLWLATYGAARQIATIIPSTRGTSTVPYLESPPTVSYLTETQAIPPSDFAIGVLGISIRKRGTLTKISNELTDDAGINTLDMWVRITANALLAVEDGELINGDGGSGYGGEVGLLASLGAAGVVSAAAGRDTWPELEPDDFAACMAMLPEQFSNGNEQWLCSPSFYAAGMLASVGGSAQGFDPRTGKPMFMGRPVVLTSKMPRTSTAASICCLYGDFASAVTLADRGLHFAASDVAPGAFAEDCTLMRAVSRYDLNVSNGGTASEVGAYVGLKTAS